ncbi:MAG: methyltransferase domain-containing protein [Dehalococcoidia bacterium]
MGITGLARYSDYRRYVDFKRLAFIARAVRELSPHGARGLDVGCGRGSVTAPLARLGCRMLGVDIFQSIIENARQNGTKLPTEAHPSPQFLLADAQSLPFRPGSFDFVICSEILEHLHCPERALHEASKMLAEGGWLIVTVPNGYGLYDLLFHHLRDLVARVVSPLPSSERVGGHVQAFTLGKIKRLTEEAGFTVVKAAKADFLSWLPILDRWQRLGRVDCGLADKLPSALVGGYFLLCQKGIRSE